MIHLIYTIFFLIGIKSQDININMDILMDIAKKIDLIESH